MDSVVGMPNALNRWFDWSAPTDASRESIGRVLGLLTFGRIQPEMAEAWAQCQTENVDDLAASLAMSRIRSCGHRLNPSTYLFTVADFRVWREEFNT